jgi:predicted lipoprotein with Yx(FWY)xxD motif
MKIKSSFRRLFIPAASLILPLAFILLGISGCDKSKDDPAPAYSIKVTANGTWGNILTDSEGRTLYYFANDFNGTRSCTSGCLAIWPVFHHNEQLTIDPALNPEDFSTILHDGVVQTSYKGWPLYYFVKDGKQENAGETGGQDIGGVWFVAKADYAVMYSNTQLIGIDGNNYKSDFTIGVGLTKYFSDDKGRTIYLREGDKNGINRFTNATYSNDAAWPLFYMDIEKASFSETLLKNDFAVITVGPENRKQLTYKGWPLYYYGGDTQRGQNKGVSVGPAGGSPVWHVVNANTAIAPN